MLISEIKMWLSFFFFSLLSPLFFALLLFLSFLPFGSAPYFVFLSLSIFLLSHFLRWCRCCGRLIETREEMTAPSILTSLRTPTLPSTSASGRVEVCSLFHNLFLPPSHVHQHLSWSVSLCLQPHCVTALCPAPLFSPLFAFASLPHLSSPGTHRWNVLWHSSCIWTHWSVQMLYE